MIFRARNEIGINYDSSNLLGWEITLLQDLVIKMLESSFLNRVQLNSDSRQIENLD